MIVFLKQQGKNLETKAVLLSGPGELRLESLAIEPPKRGDVVIEIAHSAISTGTEKLFWTGEMPPFPGMGYPLVPGYEASGQVLSADPESGVKVGQTVFVPGASCFGEVKGLFGAAAKTLVTSAERILPVDGGLDEKSSLLALAATARHAVAGLDKALPELIVGNGVLGRLLARLTIAAGGPPPTVWEIAPERSTACDEYPVVHPDQDERRDYRTIYDASGDASLLNALIGRLAKGGEIVLAGFYAQPIGFAFPPAFMKEARFRVSAEWTRDDLVATRALIESGVLSLEGLATHKSSPINAANAYETAFTDPSCLKMILDWRNVA